jgi:hypothetical protein
MSRTWQLSLPLHYWFLLIGEGGGGDIPQPAKMNTAFRRLQRVLDLLVL